MMSAAGAVQIVNDGILYTNNMQVSRTGNATLSVAIGLVRDSTNSFDIYLPAATVLNSASLGVNGIDVGTVAVSKMYYVYVIFDPTYKNAAAVIMSLSAVAPLLPFGYGSYRLIAAWPTNSSAQFILGQYVGSGSGRNFYYDAITVTPVTAGTSNTFVAVDLTNIVPAIDGTQVQFYMNFNANAAADTAAFRPTGSSSTNGEHIMTAQVAGATAHLDQKVTLITNLATGKPEIDYKVSAGAIAIDVEGFTLNI